VQIIVPLAGKGTRLLPLTKRVPKPLVRVAGRPVMDYVMDTVKNLSVDELIVITGHLKETVERYVVEHYRVKAKFVEQKTLDGTAGAINLARPFVHGPVLIIFVDTLFDADLSLVNTVDADGILWAKEVEDYQRFGVIVTDRDGYMKTIVEKPSTPVSKLANIGLYYVKDWKTLFDGIAHVLRQPPGKGGEYYLTDAFQNMVDRGRRLYTAPVGGWYDCGKVETLLETNRHLLEQRWPRHDRGRGARAVRIQRLGQRSHLRRPRLAPHRSVSPRPEQQPRRDSRHAVSHRVGRAPVADAVARAISSCGGAGEGPGVARRGAGALARGRNATPAVPGRLDRGQTRSNPHRAPLDGWRLRPHLPANSATCRGSLVLPPGSNHHVAAPAGREAPQHRADLVLPRAGHRPPHS